jgi:acetyltransferase-like isoleucine patch superfamily enzyme/acyl carrier protein
MVPSSFVALDALPLTPNGKVDRRALPEPDTVRPDLKTGFVLPRDDLETRIAHIWEEILEVEPVGVRDSFFDLGGHSLLAMRLFARIEEAFGKDCSLATFFRSPTVEHLAGILGEGESSAPRIERAQAQSPRFTPIKDTLWSGLRNRFLQTIALYVPGATTTRVWLHRMRGVEIGTDVFIGPGVILESGFPKLVSIGNHVAIGTRCVFIAHFLGTARKAMHSGAPSVRVEDNAFIGPAVVILPSVTIGQGAVVAAGSIVNKSVPPGVMVQGNPAVPVAQCGIPLVNNTYEQFLRNLKIIHD